MSLLDRILGRTPTRGPQISASPGRPPPVRELPPTAVAAPAGSAPRPASAAEGVVRVYDPFGRRVEIGREAWRTDVLLPNLAANADTPDALHELLVNALGDGFAADVLDSARHLAASDPQPRRGAALLGAVLLELRDFAGAREILEAAIARHGEDTYLVSNLARAYAGSGDAARALALIWHALELDPNEPAALALLIATTKGDAPAALAACTRLAGFTGSWRALLWLARAALERGDAAAALQFYERALAQAHPAPADLLTQLSGDLGDHGQAAALVRLTEPRFDPAAHGLTVGNNLLRAFLELGMFAEARRLLEQLYALQRPDWRDTLIAWERKLDDAEKRYGEVSAPLDIVLMKLEQPVWARGVLGFEAVLPAKAAGAPRVHFICGSGEAQEDAGGKVVTQPTNQLGRLARAVPMFLAEELFLRTHARAAFLLPWMKQGGFVLSAKPWTRAFLPPDHNPPDLYVYLHIDARAAPWLLNVTIENAQRAATPVVFTQAFTLETAGRDVLALLSDLLPRLTILCALKREDPGEALAMPPPEQLPGYLAGIEQALAVGLAARQAGGEGFLHQERAIFDHLFDVALQGGAQLRPRMLLVNALENETRRRPDIAREYLPRLALLQQQHALPESAGARLVERGVHMVRDKAGGR